YRSAHVPGAAYADWTRDIINPDDPVPAQIAPAELFARAMAERGIGDSTHVIAVDGAGGQFATRLWWALMYYGHDAVSVLDVGFDRWVAEGRPVESGLRLHPVAIFHARARPALRATADDVMAQLGQPGVQLIDARDPGQYTGARRRGPRGGHIPGARNVPREEFFAEGGGFLPLDEIPKRPHAP